MKNRYLGMKAVETIDIHKGARLNPARQIVDGIDEIPGLRTDLIEATVKALELIDFVCTEVENFEKDHELAKKANDAFTATKLLEVELRS